MTIERLRQSLAKATPNGQDFFWTEDVRALLNEIDQIRRQAFDEGYDCGWSAGYDMAIES